MFEGLKSDAKVLKLFGVPHTFLAGCEKSGSALAFAADHFTDESDKVEHQFIEGKDFLEGDGTEGTCIAHDFSTCTLGYLMKLYIDVMFVSSPCRPYTRSRSKRMSEGTQNHEDSS